MAAAPSWLLKISIFSYVTVTGFNIWCSVPNFIKIGQFFTEIWRFYDFQNTCWILKICIFCPEALVDLPFCFLMQNFAEIGQSVDDLWLGHVTVTGFNIWCSVPNFIKIGQFLTEIWRFNDFQNGGRPPSWILHICIFCPVALVSMPFCFLIQNFAEIGLSVDELWPKKSIFKMAAAAIFNFKNFNFWSRDCNRVQYLINVKQLP